MFARCTFIWKPNFIGAGSLALGPRSRQACRACFADSFKYHPGTWLREKLEKGPHRLTQSVTASSSVCMCKGQRFRYELGGCVCTPSSAVHMGNTGQCAATRRAPSRLRITDSERSPGASAVLASLRSPPCSSYRPFCQAHQKQDLYFCYFYACFYSSVFTLHH